MYGTMYRFVGMLLQVHNNDDTIVVIHYYYVHCMHSLLLRRLNYRDTMLKAPTTFSTTTLSLLLLLLFTTAKSIFALSSSSSSSTSSTRTNSCIKIRVCEGSSCESKCRGAFTPKSSFMERIKTTNAKECERNDSSSSSNNVASIVVEEVYCMNQCKRGANVRLIKNDQVLTFNNGIMNDTEMKRKSFQSVTNEGRVDQIWGIVEEIKKGEESEIDYTESGHVDKLTDLIPKK